MADLIAKVRGYKGAGITAAHGTLHEKPPTFADKHAGPN